MAQSAVAEMTENDLSDQSEELNVSPHHHHLFDDENGYLQHFISPLAVASEDQPAFKYQDMLWGQQKYNPFHDTAEALNVTQRVQEVPNGSPALLHNKQAAFTVSENIPNSEAIPVIDSSTVPEAVRLMVEDPYFDTPMSSPSSEEVLLDPAEDSSWTFSPLFNTPSVLLNNQTIEPSSPVSFPTDDESPPPLPERTPESFVLAEEAELSDPCQRLSVIFPPNSAAAEPTRELSGSPPSPAPPLPERTPESFELAIDPVVAEPQLKVPLAVNPGLIGLSSEWSGPLKPEDAVHQDKTFARSKSLKANMNFSASVTQLDPSNVRNHCPPLVPVTPSHLSNTEDSLASPVAKRAPESFPFPAEEAHERNMLRPHSMGSTQPLLRVGMSSEWDGSSQPKKFLDVVMNRSKSVRAKSSKSEPLTAFPQLTPLPVVAAEGGSERVQQQNMNHKPPPNSDRSGNKADKSNEKGMLRTKSLKLFRHKQRPTTAPPPPPTQAGAPPPSPRGLSVFKFGFGNRFRKPKGPRSYPETWI